MLDYKPYETWEEDGANDTMQLANAKVKKMLSEYVQPALDPAIDEALQAFMAERKASEPDAFV